MRSILNAVSLLLLIAILAVTGFALVGPHKLPEKIPTHLDPLGQPDLWSTRSSLEILPVISVVVYLALSVVAAYSSLAKQAAQEDDERGPNLEALILNLIFAIKAELMGIFASIQLAALHAAHHPDDPFSAWTVCMWILLAGIFATVAWCVTVMIRMGRSQEVTP
jgi:uncharacterized membrane protein